MKIYIAGEKPKSVRELLKRLFSYYHGSQYVKGAKTYIDENLMYVQCPEDRFRSFEDVMFLVNTYFPTVNYKTVMKILLTLDIKDFVGNPCEMSMYTCSGMRRIRICYTSTGKEFKYGGLKYLDKYFSKRSWLELLAAIGITSDEQLVAVKQLPKK